MTSIQHGLVFNRQQGMLPQNADCTSKMVAMRMDERGSKLDIEGYAALLKSARNLAEGTEIHGHILGSEHNRNTYLANLLVEMYGKHGSLRNARTVFENLCKPNVFSWNIMIAAYAQNGHLREATDLFNKMPERNVVSWNSMIAAYARNGHLQEARTLFDRMPKRDVVSWNVMLTAYAQNGYLHEARKIFNQMPKRNVVSWTAIVAMHAQSGQLQEAKKLFDKMPQRNDVSWNCMVAAYAQNGHLDEARDMLQRMPLRDTVTWNLVIAGYAQEGDTQEARRMFDQMPNRDVVSWNTMVAAYARKGHLQEARSMFDRMPQRDVGSWNAVMTAYAQNGHGKQAVEFLPWMDLDGIQPDRITLVTLVEACASTAAVAHGRFIHACAVETGLHRNLSVGNALVSMYGKCGSLEDAKSVFGEMAEQNVVSWTALISVHSESGHVDDAFDLFQAMAQQGVKPDEILFVAMLSACSHAGLVLNGWSFFVSIAADYGLMPTAVHYLCMIDLLGRAGRLDEAEELVLSMPFEPDDAAWTTLLCACKAHGNVDRAASAAQRVISLDPRGASSYVALSTTYKGSS